MGRRDEDEYIHEHSLLMLAEAAAKVGMTAGLASLAPNRRRLGQDVLVPVCDYCAVARSIFSNPQETLGIDLAHAMPLDAAGLWGAMLRYSGTFEGMLCRMQRHMRMFFRYTRLLVEPRDGEFAVVCLHPDPSPNGRREQLICLFLGLILVWGRALAAEKITPVRVTMRWPGPKKKAAVEAFFGCPVRFESPEDAMFFRPETLSLPLAGQTPELAALLESQVAASIQRMTSGSILAEQVRDALIDSLSPGSVSEWQIASRLGMTVRTLRRHLAERQRSFRQLLEECRRERAETLLLEGQLSIREISAKLGYAEPASFYRAFHRWTGLTPAQWQSKAELPEFAPAQDTGKLPPDDAGSSRRGTMADLSGRAAGPS